MKILMCSPDYYGIYYEINPWMDIQRPAVLSHAKQQWQTLCRLISQLGASIELISPISGLPDMVFTANAGLIYQNQVLIANFKSPQRQRESHYFSEWFKEAGFQVVHTAQHFEGAGDALFLGEALVAAYGFRSNKDVYQEDFFQQFSMVLCELVNPSFYHLDTCFCPLNAELALWYPAAFSLAAQQQLEKSCELIAVSEEEAHRFACNAVVIDQQIILPEGCTSIGRDLEKRGFATHYCKMDEFIKAGGACKCLTLQLNPVRKTSHDARM